MDTVNAIVAYESVYGNTRQVAEAIAAGLGGSMDARAVAIADLDDEALAGADLLVLGGPTHMHGMATSLTRKMAVQAAEEDHEIHVEPGAAEGPGLRGWLKEHSGDGKAAAAFDTRADAKPAVTGMAAKGIAKRLRRRGFDVVADHESFLVEESEGPLAEGELDRARAWGEELAGRLSS